jgi:hypothetical protein
MAMAYFYEQKGYRDYVYSNIYLFFSTQQPTTIGDRQFVSFVQFFLHKCGQITLGYLDTSYYHDSPTIVNEAGRELPLADVPISENITNFKELELWLTFSNSIQMCILYIILQYLQ